MVFPSDPMGTARDRIESELPDLQGKVKFERYAGIAKDAPCILLERNGGIPMGSLQDDLMDAPVLDIYCFTNTQNVNDSYVLCARVQRALRALHCRAITGPTPVQAQRESARTRVVHITYVMYV